MRRRVWIPAVLALGAVTSTIACQLVYPDDLSTTCEGNGAFCDDFERSVPIPASSTQWTAVECDPEGSITADGALHVHYPAHPGGGFHHCAILTRETTATKHVSIDLDVTMRATAEPNSLVLDLGMRPVSARPDGLSDIDYQLAVRGTGWAELIAVYHYPDRPADAQYPAIEMQSAPQNAAWLEPGVPCHVHLDLDPTIPTFTGTSTCNGRTHLMTPNLPAPFGITGPLRLQVGFGAFASSSVPDWDLTYDNLVLTVE